MVASPGSMLTLRSCPHVLPLGHSRQWPSSPESWRRLVLRDEVGWGGGDPPGYFSLQTPELPDQDFLRTVLHTAWASPQPVVYLSPFLQRFQSCIVFCRLSLPPLALASFSHTDIKPNKPLACLILSCELLLRGPKGTCQASPLPLWNDEFWCQFITCKNIFHGLHVFKAYMRREKGGGIKMAKNESSKGEGGWMALYRDPCLQDRTTVLGTLGRYKTAISWPNYQQPAYKWNTVSVTEIKRGNC